MNSIYIMGLKFLVAAMFTVSIVKAESNLLEYPEGFRYWTHVKSMVIQDGHPLHDSFGGIHHIYANDKAMLGYQNGVFPDGSVIIFDLLDVTNADNSIVEAKRKVLGVMEKDTKRFSDTAGWGFEGFAAGDSETRAIGEDYKQACFACHTSQKDNDYVFSKWRE